MNNKELFTALTLLEKEKGIPMDYMIEQIERAIRVACKNFYGGNENVVFKIVPEKNTFDVKLIKTVVEADDVKSEQTAVESAKPSQLAVIDPEALRSRDP